VLFVEHGEKFRVNLLLLCIYLLGMRRTSRQYEEGFCMVCLHHITCISYLLTDCSSKNQRRMRACQIIGAQYILWVLVLSKLIHSQKGSQVTLKTNGMHTNDRKRHAHTKTYSLFIYCHYYLQK